MIGIYKIRSKKRTDRVYIGSSRDVDRRLTQHIRFLIRGKHPNIKLQNHYNKYGESDLDFSFIMDCSIEDLLKEEQFYMDSYKPYFNLRPKAESNLGATVSEETKEKLRIYNTGKKHTEETKIKCRSYRHTEEAKIKISLAGMGRKVSKKHIESLLLRRCKPILDTENGIIHKSITSASKHFKINRKRLSDMLHGTDGKKEVLNTTTLVFSK